MSGRRGPAPGSAEDGSAFESGIFQEIKAFCDCHRLGPPACWRSKSRIAVDFVYGHVDARGTGVRNEMIPGMRAHNGSAPDLVEEAHRIIVRPWKQAGAGRGGKMDESGIGWRSAGKRDRGRVR